MYRVFVSGKSIRVNVFFICMSIVPTCGQIGELV